MPIERVFIDWNEPLLPAVVQRLLADCDLPIDLSETIVVVPGSRAGRSAQRYRLLGPGLDRHAYHAISVPLRVLRPAVDVRRLVPGAQELDLCACGRRAALRGVLFEVAGPIRVLGEPGENLRRSASTGERERKVRQAGPKWGGRPRKRPPHLYVDAFVRRCNTCRTRSGGGTSRISPPPPS